jgi:hypothetical protein
MLLSPSASATEGVRLLCRREAALGRLAAEEERRWPAL